MSNEQELTKEQGEQIYLASYKVAERKIKTTPQYKALNRKAKRAFIKNMRETYLKNFQ